MARHRDRRHGRAALVADRPAGFLAEAGGNGRALADDLAADGDLGGRDLGLAGALAGGGHLQVHAHGLRPARQPLPFRFNDAAIGQGPDRAAVEHARCRAGGALALDLARRAAARDGQAVFDHRHGVVQPRLVG